MKHHFWCFSKAVFVHFCVIYILQKKKCKKRVFHIFLVLFVFKNVKQFLKTSIKQVVNIYSEIWKRYEIILIPIFQIFSVIPNSPSRIYKETSRKMNHNL